jgi:hypothetical protein
MTTGTNIALRATISELCGRRDHALRQFGEAHAALVAASAAIDNAREAWTAASPGITSYNYATKDEAAAFMAGLKVPLRDDFMATARRLIDADVWAHIVKVSDLERLMDKRAKDQLRQQLITDPPEVTEANVAATVEGLILDADTIFKRGIAECFSNLDRRFRSHDGWKIGSRVILTRAFNEFGTWNYYREHRDTLRDIERTFLVLDGKEAPQYGSIVDMLS